MKKSIQIAILLLVCFTFSDSVSATLAKITLVVSNVDKKDQLEEKEAESEKETEKESEENSKTKTTPDSHQYRFLHSDLIYSLSNPAGNVRIPLNPSSKKDTPPPKFS